MQKIQIVGHRGAAGLITENTIDSIKKGVELGVDALEFDIWTSKDGVPVLSHDSSLARLTGQQKQIYNLKLDQIKKIRLNDGQQIPTGSEALQAASQTPVFLEIKDYYLSQGVLDLLDKFKNHKIYITSFNHSVLLELQKKRPDLPLFAASHWHPFHAIHFAAQNSFAGVTLNYKTLTLPVYWYAHRQKLKIMVFTVNSVWIMKFYGVFFKRLSLCTNYPDRAVKVLR